MSNNRSVRYVQDGVRVQCKGLNKPYCRLMETLNNNKPASVFTVSNAQALTDAVVIYKLSDTITMQSSIARAVSCICATCRMCAGKEKVKSLKEDDKRKACAQQLQQRRVKVR